jgi:hypothetical protein
MDSCGPSATATSGPPPGPVASWLDSSCTAVGRYSVWIVCTAKAPSNRVTSRAKKRATAAWEGCPGATDTPAHPGSLHSTQTLKGDSSISPAHPQAAGSARPELAALAAGAAAAPEQVCGLQLVHAQHPQLLPALLPPHARQQGPPVAVHRRQHRLAAAVLLVQRHMLHLCAVLRGIQRRRRGRHPCLCDVHALLAALSRESGRPRQPHAVQVPPRGHKRLVLCCLGAGKGLYKGHEARVTTTKAGLAGPEAGCPTGSAAHRQRYPVAVRCSGRQHSIKGQMVLCKSRKLHTRWSTAFKRRKRHADALLFGGPFLVHCRNMFESI